MTLQKKLDDLGDRLKRNHEGHQPTDKLDTSNPPKGHESMPYLLKYCSAKCYTQDSTAQKAHRKTL